MMMVINMVLKELTNQEFKLFTESYPIKSIYQTTQYGFIMNEENFDSVFLGLMKNDIMVAGSLILIDKNKQIKKAYAPRGILIDYTDIHLLNIFTKEIKKWLYRRNIISLVITPPVIKKTIDVKNSDEEDNPNVSLITQNLHKVGYRYLGDKNFFEGLKPKFEAVLDVSLPYYQLFKNIKKQFRTKIRSAAKRGIRVYKGNEVDLEKLYNQTKKKYPRQLEYFKNCYYFFKKDNKIEFYYTKLDTVTYLKRITSKYNEQSEKCLKIDQLLSTTKSVLNEKIREDALLDQYKNELVVATRLLSQYPDGIITSSILIGKDKENVYLLMDGFNTTYKKFNSKHLLIWKLIEKYSKEGYHTFHLGGITNPNIPKNKYSGLNEFKLSFNAKAVEYLGDFELVTNKFMYMTNKIFN